MRLQISKINEMAKNRPDGYAEDVLSRGVISGEWLKISSESLAELREKYRPSEERQGILKQAASFASAMSSEAKAIAEQQAPVSEEDQAARLAICQGCDFYDGHRCKKCGCFMNLKTRLRSASCPIGKW